MKLRMVLWMLSLVTAISSNAEEPELKVKPSGRILFDAAHIHGQQLIWRVRGSWTKVTNRSGYADNEVTIFETRLQVKF